MSRPNPTSAAMAAAMLGMQDPDNLAAAFAMALVMHTLEPWREPTGRDLERARKTAARYKLSEDLAVFVPRERKGLIGRMVKDEYLAVIIALKQLDSLQGAEREAAIAEVRMLLGGGQVQAERPAGTADRSSRRVSSRRGRDGNQ